MGESPAFLKDQLPNWELLKLINELIATRGNEFEAISIPFKSHFCGKWMEHCGWWPGYTMPRVLKRGHFRFREELHSGVEVHGREIRLPPDPNLAIEHYSYRSIEHYVEKFNRYTSTEAQNLASHGTPLDWRTGLREMVRDLWLYYEQNNGHLDGIHGWILSWLAGQYRWFSHAKLLDVALSKDENSKPSPYPFPKGERGQLPPQVTAAEVPKDLDEVFSEVQRELTRPDAYNFEGDWIVDPSLPVAMANNTPAVRAAILASTVMPSAATTDSDGGRNWSNGHWRQSIYNHVTPPNSKSVKRGTGQSSDGGVPATSHHPGGVNVLMADGATRFVKESVSADVWAAVGGRKDGITLSLSNL